MLKQMPVLIVEDESLIALGLAIAVADFGGVVVGPVATVLQALAMIETLPIAAALLDANLADRDVTPVALKLLEKDVPFVVHTGNGLPPDLAIAYPGLTVIPKPAVARYVVEMLAKEVLVRLTQ
jgi:CheY-like chemotaxis protein